MKKRVVMLFLVLCVSMAFVGCQNDKSNDDTSDTESIAGSEDSTEDTKDAASIFEEMLLEYRALDYVTLGEYKGLEVTQQSVEVTDEDVQTAVEESLSAYTKEVTDRVTQEGDIINMDYEGKLDGVAFDGGTQEGASVTVGSSGFIDGFDEGLVGKTIGETFDLDLTFPEDYSLDESLAGQAVVFTVTINSIAESMTMEDFNDEWVAANTDFTTVEEYTANQKETLTQEKESAAEEALYSDLWTAAMAVSTVNEVPQELKDAEIEYEMENIVLYAEQYGMETAEFIESAFGMTEEEYREYLAENSDAYVGELLIMLAIVENENIGITDENFDDELAKYSEKIGYEVEYLEANATQARLIISMNYNNVMELLKEHAIITIDESAETVDESVSDTTDESDTTTDESDTSAE